MKKWMLFFCLAFCAVAHGQNTPADTTLMEFTGKYLFPEGSVVSEVNLSLGSDGVLTSSSTAGTSELVRKEKDLFDIPKFQGTAKFIRDSKGVVIGVTIDAMGYHLEGSKASGNLVMKKEYQLRFAGR